MASDGEGGFWATLEVEGREHAMEGVGQLHDGYLHYGNGNWTAWTRDGKWAEDSSFPPALTTARQPSLEERARACQVEDTQPEVDHYVYAYADSR